MNRTNFTAIFLFTALTLAMASSAHAQPRGGRGGNLGQILGGVNNMIREVQRGQGGGGGNRDGRVRPGGGNSNRGGSNRHPNGVNLATCRSGRCGGHPPNQIGPIIDNVEHLVGTILENIPQNGGCPGNGSHPDHDAHVLYDDFDGYYPDDGYYVSPPTNTPPPQQTDVAVKPNKKAEKKIVPVVPSKNSSFHGPGTAVSRRDIRAGVEQYQDGNKEAIDGLAKELPNENQVGNAVGAVAPAVPAADQADLRNKALNGDTAGVLAGLTPAQKASPAGKALIETATAYAALNDAKEKADAGTLTRADTDQLRQDLSPFYTTPAERQAGNDLIFDLAGNSAVINGLNNAQIGDNVIPGGDDVEIIWVDSLADGTVVSLGDDTVLVGTGSGGGGIAVSTGCVAQAMGMSTAAGPPLPESKSEMVTSGVVLLNGGDSQVNYNVNQKQFSMGPNYTQALPAGQSWLVEFDTAGSQGKVEYTLNEGTYKFTQTDDGWALYKTTFSVTIDNSDNPFEFQYVINNQQQSVAAGAKQEHSGKYPPIVRFDNGEGGERRKRLDSGAYCVAVGDDNMLDLYAPDDVQPPVPPEQIAAAARQQNRAALFGQSGSSARQLFGDTGDTGGTKSSLFGKSANKSSGLFNERRKASADLFGPDA